MLPASSLACYQHRIAVIGNSIGGMAGMLNAARNNGGAAKRRKISKTSWRAIVVDARTSTHQ